MIIRSLQEITNDVNNVISDGGSSTSASSSASIPMSDNNVTSIPSPSPTAYPLEPEEIHEHDANVALILNVTLIGCVLLAYYIKVHRLYYLPESAAALLIGIVLGGIARIFLGHDQLSYLEFSPELFFFVLLPPIIFEAGYSLQRKNFFENFGAILGYAALGTMISTFLVGYFTFGAARLGLVGGVDVNDPMEALLFGALISAVDPVATLSIMGSPSLQCDQLLYSLVFGESVLNDAIAIVLFKTFHAYYVPPGELQEDGSTASGATAAEEEGGLGGSNKIISAALGSFVIVSLCSILVGILLGLLASFIYRHNPGLREHPHLESALLFLFCYCCYATAEALNMSGIMALFFNGIVLAHYNSYNLSETAHVTADQIFATLAVVSETMVFLYMGMGVFTGRFQHAHLWFSFLALLFCLLGRALNIFPLSWLANRCRGARNKIPFNMQCVLWFAGLRGAIAFALSENMPGPNKETYVTATLSICIFTTVVCGGFTERVLSETGMKQDAGASGSDVRSSTDHSSSRLENGSSGGVVGVVGVVSGGGHGASGGGDADSWGVYDQLVDSSPTVRQLDLSVRTGVKGAWKSFDNSYLKPYFGGSPTDRRHATPDRRAAERAKSSPPHSIRSGGAGEDMSPGRSRLGDFELCGVTERGGLVSQSDSDTDDDPDFRGDGIDTPPRYR